MSSAPCANCGAAQTGEYCADCGERRLRPDALSLRRFARESFEALTDLDGRLPRSLRALIGEPGRLTAEYCAGRRVAWVRPFQLFLLAAVVFFLLSGWQTFSTPLRIHLVSQSFPHRAAAERLITADLTARFGAAAGPAVEAFMQRRDPPLVAAAAHAELRDYAERFDAHGQLLARTLVFLMIPLLALGVWLLRLPAREAGVRVVVFTTHFTTALLLILVFAGLLVRGGAALARSVGLSGGFAEGLGTSAIFSLVGVYAGLAMQRTFGDRWSVALLRSLLLIVWLYLMLLVYRAFLFYAVRWTL